MPQDTATPTEDTKGTYRVLARKYRPNSVDELVGQDSVVKTLINALKMGRLAHAFVLTGVRGVGKTSTARIIAKGLNCTGADGTGEPTMNPCGICTSCIGTAEGRNVDVLEMDAASNTGVDDVREIIDGVGYRPMGSRYRIYIIDEVHMLSKNAFNALLKTLEEPPDSVKFIFATTEIRKVPITVLSRCQRFDLRRVPIDMMSAHLQQIAEKEKITIDDEALLRLARAAEGSVRDALSLLDQAAALTGDTIDDAAVAAMLGQAGRMDSLAITRAALEGDIATALDKLKVSITGGAEAQAIIQDMLDFIHLASRVAVGGACGDLAESEAEALRNLAGKISVAALARAWQIALKGHREITLAPNPHAATEMVLIRLAYAASLPTPAELVSTLNTPESRSRQGAATASAASGTAAAPATPTTPVAPTPSEAPTTLDTPVAPTQSEAPTTLDTPVAPTPSEAPTTLDTPVAPPTPSEVTAASNVPENLREMVRLFEDRGEVLLASNLRIFCRAVTVEAGKFEFTTNPKFDHKVIGQIAEALYRFTGIRWAVESVETEGAPTLNDEDRHNEEKNRAELEADPLVKAALETFPGSDFTVKPLPDDAENSIPPAPDEEKSDYA